MMTERLSEGPQFLQVRLTDLQAGFTYTITHSIRNIQFSIRNQQIISSVQRKLSVSPVQLRAQNVIEVPCPGPDEVDLLV